MKIYYLIILIPVLFIARYTPDQSLHLNADYSPELINVWVESTEEGPGIYRLENFTGFPESRYRQVYNFMSDNTCEYLVLSPADAHYMENGWWDYNDRLQIISIYNENKKLISKLKVNDITPNLLHIDLFGK